MSRYKSGTTLRAECRVTGIGSALEITGRNGYTQGGKYNCGCRKKWVGGNRGEHRGGVETQERIRCAVRARENCDTCASQARLRSGITAGSGTRGRAVKNKINHG